MNSLFLFLAGIVMLHDPPMGIPPDALVFEKGFIVTLESDTMAGLIQAHTADQDWIEFIDLQDDFCSRWSADELISYKIGDTQYESHIILYRWEGNHSRAFLKVEETGFVNLYSREVKRLRGKGGGKGPGHHTRTQWYLEQEGDLVAVSSYHFQNRMIHYFQEVPDLAEKLRQGEYQYRDLPRLVREYNASMQLASP